ncbi:MAG: type I-C CRISPR-associated protein Cas8c/Csd1, partial [candidate division WOR-3 bacterium]
MIMQSLVEAYERFKEDSDYEIGPRGFSLQRISFTIVLEMDGQLHDIQDIREHAGKKRIPRRLRVLGVNKPTGFVLSPCFLWDNTAYLLGCDKDKGKRGFAAFEETRKRYLEVENEINDPKFSAVCRFLKGWNPQDAGKYQILEELIGSFGVFQIRAQTGYVHESTKIEKWWLNRTDADEERMKAWWESSCP